MARELARLDDQRQALDGERDQAPAGVDPARRLRGEQAPGEREMHERDAQRGERDSPPPGARTRASSFRAAAPAASSGRSRRSLPIA